MKSIQQIRLDMEEENKRYKQNLLEEYFDRLECCIRKQIAEDTLLDMVIPIDYEEVIPHLVELGYIVKSVDFSPRGYSRENLNNQTPKYYIDFKSTILKETK